MTSSAAFLTGRASQWVNKLAQRATHAYHSPPSVAPRASIPLVATPPREHGARAAMPKNSFSLQSRNIKEMSLGARRMSSYNVDQAAMQDLLTSPNNASNLPTDTLVFVLATANQGGQEQMVLLSTRCPQTKLYTITLPFAQLRAHEDTGLAAARALIDAGIKSSHVVRKGNGVAIHPGGLDAQVIVETISIHSLDSVSSPSQGNIAVVMAPVGRLRQSFMTLASEGRVIDENLFFFAAGIESVSGGIQGAGAGGGVASALPSAVGAAAAKTDFVARFGGIVGTVWMGGSILYGLSCMHFAY